MLGCSRLTNLILSIAIAIVLTFMVAATIIAYSVSEVIRDREIMKEKIKDDRVKEEFINYLQDEFKKQTDGNLSLIIDDSAAQDILADPAAEAKIDQTLDDLVDQTYDWLEGKGANPTLSIDSSKSDEPTLLEEEIRGKLGPVGDLINYDELNEASSKFRLYEVKGDQINAVPELYGTVNTLYKKLFIGVVILSAVLLLSARSIRKGAFVLGLVLMGAGLLVLFGPKYVDRSPAVEARIEQQTEKLPWIVNTLFKESADTIKNIDTPTFVDQFGVLMLKEIQDHANLYAKIALAFGAVIAVGTQLSIKRSEAEADLNRSSSSSRSRDNYEDSYIEDSSQFTDNRSQDSEDSGRRVRTIAQDYDEVPEDDEEEEEIEE